MAHHLPELSRVAQALDEGMVSVDQVRVLLGAGERLNEEFVRDQGLLLEAVSGLSVADTRRLLSYWRDALEGPAAAMDADYDYMQRYLHASRTIHGMVRLDGFLDSESGDMLITALAAATPPGGVGETRTPSQRRADALVDLARSYLDGGTATGGEKPHVMVLTDLQALQGVASEIHGTASGEEITAEAVRRIACDSTVSRIMFGADSGAT